MNTYDYVVVGSGCAGAMAAQTLVEAGAKVTMLDVGTTNQSPAAPDDNFADLRKHDERQYRYLIGEHGEGINWDAISKGAQLTPPRQYLTDLIDQYIPLQSDTFSPLESLSYGGLGVGWGLQCWEFSKTDLARTGLPVTRLTNAYETISQRIGISASDDRAAPYTIGRLRNYQPSAAADLNHRYLQDRYSARAERFKKDGFFVGRTPLALLTEQLDDRQAYRYQDMDFYANNGESAWRPWVSVDRLRKQPNFTYQPDSLVTAFSEKDGVVTLVGINTKTSKQFSLRCRQLVLACGALGSARIVLRSLGDDNSRLPLLSNPHCYVPCLQPALVGREAEAQRLSLGQLSYFLDPNGTDSGLSVASSYSYQSLMLFRLLNQVPLNFNDGRLIMRYLLSGLIITIVQHPDEFSDQKYLRLQPAAASPTGDELVANYQPTDAEEQLWNQREKQYVAALRKLRTYALKRVHPPHGSAIHYAGTIPFSKTEQPFRLSPQGRLYGTRNVYVADSAGFNYLPAKGLTFSLMANAHLTAENVLHHEA